MMHIVNYAEHANMSVNVDSLIQINESVLRDQVH